MNQFTIINMAHGGKRKGAGRKPSLDKKQIVVLYIKTSKIENTGGYSSLREYLYNCVDHGKMIHKKEIYEKMKRKNFGESMCDETKLNVLNFIERQLRLYGV